MLLIPHVLLYNEMSKILLWKKTGKHKANVKGDGMKPGKGKLIIL